jgi:hypothetical protein
VAHGCRGKSHNKEIDWSIYGWRREEHNELIGHEGKLVNRQDSKHTINNTTQSNLSKEPSIHVESPRLHLHVMLDTNPGYLARSHQESQHRHFCLTVDKENSIWLRPGFSFIGPPKAI